MVSAARRISKLALRIRLNLSVRPKAYTKPVRRIQIRKYPSKNKFASQIVDNDFIQTAKYLAISE